MAESNKMMDNPNDDFNSLDESIGKLLANPEAAPEIGLTIQKIFRPEFEILQANPSLLHPNIHTAYVPLKEYPSEFTDSLKLGIDRFLARFNNPSIDSRDGQFNYPDFVAESLTGDKPSEIAIHILPDGGWETVRIRVEKTSLDFSVIHPNFHEGYRIRDDRSPSSQSESEETFKFLYEYEHGLGSYEKSSKAKAEFLTEYNSKQSRSFLLHTHIANQPYMFGKDLFKAADMHIVDSNRLNTEAEYQQWLQLHKLLFTKSHTVGRPGTYGFALYTGYIEQASKKPYIGDVLETENGIEEGSDTIFLPVEFRDMLNGKTLGYRVAMIERGPDNYRAGLLDLRFNRFYYKLGGGKID